MAGNLGKAVLRMHELKSCNSVLDYGTGKGKLVLRLRKEVGNSIVINGYDPAERWEKTQSKARYSNLPRCIRTYRT